jgi:hypothetical protein
MFPRSLQRLDSLRRMSLSLDLQLHLAPEVPSQVTREKVAAFQGQWSALHPTFITRDLHRGSLRLARRAAHGGDRSDRRRELPSFVVMRVELSQRF